MRMKKLDFEHRIVITGYGIVAQAALPLLMKHVNVRPGQITVIDFCDRTEALRPWLETGTVRFVKERVTPENFSCLLSQAVGPGGLIIDLAWSTDFFAMAEWAHKNKVLYVNTSLETWGPSDGLQTKSVIEKSLYCRYVRALELASKWRGAPTAVLDHGANPGLVSSFVKKGLIDIAMRVLRENRLSNGRQGHIEAALERGDFPNLARELGVKVIHCSERDTQRASTPKTPDQFVGTWSVEAMWDESISPSEFGWGTHEMVRPHSAVQPDFGPRNVLILPRMGMNTWVRSWVPHGEIVGMAITHGECFGLSHALTVHENGKTVYRPTVLYAYLPCAESLISLHELRCRNYELHPVERIMAEDIHSGTDAIGALIMGHPFKSWWTGSILSIEEARKIVPNVSATAVQVAAGVIAGVLWAIQNPSKGLCFPEDLPHEEILSIAAPYLGQFVSEPVDWTPLQGRRVFFKESAAAKMNGDDPWQFENFLFHP
ncbi:MAG TPA: saccharopine dehydrogenase C-terminal domain-containing protein [Bryobacteraceae bacterium]|nr:saccharopine dehydrogenase C-terminal domain-containing protein [Bryobacteraceae bacterium]